MVMQAKVSGVLADALAAGRQQFNARVADACKRQPQFDPASLSEFVRDAIDPIACAVHAVEPDRTTTVVAAAFDLALDLVAQGRAGPAARQPWVDIAWRETAPCHAELLARTPVDTLGALTNAVLHLSAVPGARVAKWLQQMGDVGRSMQVSDVATLRGYGQVAAWRAGMAHFRDGALAAAEALPEVLALHAVGARPGRSWAQVRHALADPWWDEPAGSVRTEPMQVGAFSGFDGGFPEPPQLRMAADGFVLRSGGRHVWLVADAQGAVLLPATEEAFDAAALPAADPRASLQGTSLQISSRITPLALPEHGRVLACGTHAAAIVSSWSHAVWLFPLPA